MDILDDDKPKKVFLKIKYILIIILLGLLTTRVGAVGKITSVPWGNSLLTIGLFIQVIGYILGIIKLFTIKEVRDFLNR